MAERTLRSRLAGGETVLGTWLTIGDPFAAELVARAGWDWALVDMEHGPVSLEAAATMVTALRTTAATALVRPAWNEPAQIQRVLDLGCAGIIVPVVNTADDARRVVRDARFPPLGERSRGAVRPVLAFGEDYGDRANETVLVFVQIESELAVANVEAIAAVDGIDGLFVGPYDLASSMAKRWPEVWNRDPVYMATIARVAAVARAAGKIAGILANDPGMAAEMARLGYGFLGIGTDAGFLRTAARRAVEGGRSAIAPPAEPATAAVGAAGTLDDALAPLRRRLERVKLSETFVRGLLIPGSVLDPDEVALRWAGMPNKNERAATGELLEALAAAGFVVRDGERYRVLRAPD